MKIGYFGEMGAYSNIAAKRMMAGEYVPMKFIKSIFDSMKRNEIDYGVVPIENSIEGSVNETYDNLFNENFYVVKEYFLRINHCLIGFKGTEIDAIKCVHSHPQALAQCSDFIYRNNMIPISEYDTAGSINIIKNLKNVEHAAIASELAAGIYNMEILKRDIENNKNNYTRFFLISKKEEEFTGNTRTSIVFSTENKPGALHKILGIFEKYGINMSKIESRPVKYNPFNYIYFIDFEDNQYSKNALDDVKNSTSLFKKIGTYKIAGLDSNI